MVKTYLVACVLIAVGYSVACIGAESYPPVSPMQTVIDVANVAEANIWLAIRAPNGNPLYKLECHSPNYIDPNFNYSGDFECRLSSIGHIDVYSTLLTEDAHQSTDWESRGRFFAAELRGPCSLIPEFGATRSFKLRGMQLTLQIVDSKFSNNGKLNSLKLRVVVRSDPLAHRAIAAIVPFPKNVPAECEHLLEHYFVNPSTFSKQKLQRTK